MPISRTHALGAAASLVLALAAPDGALAAPTVIDFDVAQALGIASYSAAGVTFTSGTPGGTVTLLSGANASGNLLGNYIEAYVDNEPGFGIFDPMRADFDNTVGSVSVDLGDYASTFPGEGDGETLFLYAYDANDQFLVGVTVGITEFQPLYQTLSVQFAGIKYAQFGSYGGYGGSSVYADNFSFDTGRTGAIDLGHGAAWVWCDGRDGASPSRGRHRLNLPRKMNGTAGRCAHPAGGSVNPSGCQYQAARGPDDV